MEPFSVELNVLLATGQNLGSLMFSELVDLAGLADWQTPETIPQQQQLILSFRDELWPDCGADFRRTFRAYKVVPPLCVDIFSDPDSGTRNSPFPITKSTRIARHLQK